MAFYDEMAATALALITRFGRTIAVTRETAGGYDPATGGVTAPVLLSQTANGVVREYSHQHVDGTLIQAGDQRVILAASGMDFAPAPGDRITVGSLSLGVVSVQERNPGGTSLVYELQVRR